MRNSHGCEPRLSKDFIIRDGRLIGKYEDLYVNSEDPWNQSRAFSQHDSRRLLALEHSRRLRDEDSRVSRTLEIGSGFGYLTHRLTEMGFAATGIDVAPTAVKRAKELHPGSAFFAVPLKMIVSLTHMNPTS